MEYGFSSFMIDKAPPPFVNELRIGNWISSYMAFMDDKEFSHKEIRKMQVDGELMKYLIDNPMSTFKGILLSSDILEKCGAVRQNSKGCDDYHLFMCGGGMYLKIFKLIENDRFEAFELYYVDNNGDDVFPLSIQSIEYLHDLQNFIKSISGEELTVNL